MGLLPASPSVCSCRRGAEEGVYCTIYWSVHLGLVLLLILLWVKRERGLWLVDVLGFFSAAVSEGVESLG